MNDRNGAQARRYFDEVINRRRLEVIDELFAPRYREHDPANAVDTRGPDGVRAEVAATLRALPDLEETVDDLVVDGDRVAVRWTMRGSHDGMLMDIAPTNRPIEVGGMVIFRFEDGRIAEAWWNWNVHGLLRQVRAAAEAGPIAR